MSTTPSDSIKDFEQLRADDNPVLVAGLGRRYAEPLVAARIPTLEALGDVMGGGLAGDGRRRLVRLNDGENDVGIGPKDADAAAAQRPGGKALRQFGPRFTAVERLVDAGVGAGLHRRIAAGKRPAPHLVKASVEQV